MNILCVILIAAAVWILIALFKKPIKFIVKMLVNTLVGFLILFLLNLLGLDIELNFINALITGVLGIPGVIILLILKYIL